MVLATWHGVIEEADERAAPRHIAPDDVQHDPNVLPRAIG